jgi:anti-sigma-K factor RskA
VIDHDAADELLAGYVLGSLTGPDAEAADRLLDEHVPDCITCRGTLDAFRGVTGELGLVAEPLAPPEPLLPRIERELAGGRRRRFPQWTPARMVAGAAAAVILLGVVGLSLMNDGGSGPSQLLTKADLATVTDLARSPGSHVTPVGDASEVDPPAHDELYIMWTGVPAPEAGSTYRLWAVRGDAVSYLGDFLPDNGVVALRIAVDPTTVDHLLITSEPLGSPPSQPVASVQEAG